MSSSYQSSRSSATHRRAATPPIANNTASSGSIQQYVDPAPTPRPIFQFLGFGFILFLVFLQFLPATHFRHPSDPLRSWTPFDDSTAGILFLFFLFSQAEYSRLKLLQFGATSDGNSSSAAKNNREDGMVHVVSWMDCLDLRLLAVLANSTLLSSRYPHLVFFHFFIPKGNEDKVSFFKLKVLFPHSNLEIHGQEEVKEIIAAAISGTQFAGSSFVEVAPFIIPSVHQSLTKFIYISPNILMKGKVEDLIGTALSNYAIGAAEDCSRKLDMFVDSNVLDAIQRSASNPWVSETPYAKNACMPDLSVLLIDSTKLDGDFVDAFLWWSKVLNLNERSSGKNSAIVLALYNKYLKLSNSWSVTLATSSETINNTRVIQYDIPNSVCSQFGSGATPQISGNGNIWKHYLSPMSDQILGS
ncbi:uncharacterized protein LOC121264666 isoform X1 [Juglans microcarpa x Juglans regia]|uniref:uncharacterized protein LOC121264666 isoform X1 n=1 Tax=Juglans microcarpa x Juglans regia TaxID=2249226 RepID=UPI001B7DE313|nr:uncharacterized protein LOC121264666 isoform X1 [Juglans microcarpa x Juglans regia]